MKTIPFPDRLNAVFVKELRQSIHDRSLWIAAAVLAAGQLFLAYYWAYCDRANWSPVEMRTWQGGSGLMLLFVVLLVVRAHWAQRAGQESGREGFDPLCGTGYPVWKAIAGRFAAECCELAALALLTVPWFLWLYCRGQLQLSLGESLPTGAMLLFCLGEGFHYFTGLARGRGPALLVIALALMWGVGMFYAVLCSSRIISPKHCGLLLLFGITLMCGQLQDRMPVRADRGAAFKTAILATMVYALVFWREDAPMILFGAGYLLMFGSLFERRIPSRRQIENAPRNAVLRFLRLFVSSGVLPGFLLSSVLIAAAAFATRSLTPLAPMLLWVFYMQLALAVSRVWRIPPFAAYLACSIVPNMLIISGDALPWLTALSPNADFYIGREAALAVAASACAAGIALNAKLYWRFLLMHFVPEFTEANAVETRPHSAGGERIK